jgi:hypothetical protein
MKRESGTRTVVQTEGGAKRKADHASAARSATIQFSVRRDTTYGRPSPHTRKRRASNGVRSRREEEDDGWRKEGGWAEERRPPLAARPPLAPLSPAR